MHFSKKCSVFKVVLSALLIVALLQLLYLSFLSKLHGKQQRYKYSELFGSLDSDYAFLSKHYHRLNESAAVRWYN